MGKQEATQSKPFASTVVITTGSTQSQQQMVDEVVHDVSTDVSKTKVTNSEDDVAVMNDSAGASTKEIRKHDTDVDESSQWQPLASMATTHHNVIVHPNGKGVAAGTKKSGSALLDDDEIKKKSLMMDGSCHAVTLVVGEYVEMPNIVNTAPTLPIVTSCTAISSNAVDVSRTGNNVQSNTNNTADAANDIKTRLSVTSEESKTNDVAAVNDAATNTSEIITHEANVDVSSQLQPETSKTPLLPDVHPNGEDVGAGTRQSQSVLLDDNEIKKQSQIMNGSCHAVTLVVGEYVEMPNNVNSATTLPITISSAVTLPLTTNTAASIPVTSNTTAITNNAIVTSRRENKIRSNTNNNTDERIPGAFRVQGVRRSFSSNSYEGESTSGLMDDLEDSHQISFTSYSDIVDGPFQEAALDPKLGDTKVIDTEALRRQGVVDMDYCLDDEDNFAEAVPVEADQGEDRFLPAAIEFDPDQKNDAASKSRNKTYACLVIVVLIIIMSVVVGVVVALSSNGSSQLTVNPRDMLGITQFVVSQLGLYASAVEDVNSPYHMALNWMTYYDPLNLTIEAPNFMQRYLLAYTYYATSASRPWEYCVPPIDNTTQPGPCRYGTVSYLSEGLGLVTFTKSNGYWLSSDKECQWAGIVCDRSGNIVILALAGMNMTGSLSRIQQLLPFVNYFDLSRNELQGPLPGSTFQKSKHLRYVLLADNSLTGSIPSDIWSLRNLRKISLWTNTLTGLLPDPFDFWKDAKELQLSKNRFNGTIPSTISRLQNARKILLDNNLLTGPLPTGLFTNPSLGLLYLDSNVLSKNIPKMIDLPAIVELNLGSNRLTGSVPDDIYNCSLLTVLDLHDNFLSGSLSPLIGKLTSLDTLALADNSFTGTIPPAVANLTVLVEASFDGTNFSGTIPSSLCTTKLKTLTADCDEITCTCCTCS